MPLSTSSLPFKTLLIGAFLSLPSAAALAGERDPDPPSDAVAEIAATLAGENVEAAPRERSGKALSRDIAKRREEQALEKSWFSSFSFFPDKPAEREVLFSLDQPAHEKSFFQEHFRFSLRKGVEYRQSVPVGDQQWQLRIWGPVVGKSPGLGLELDGLRRSGSRVKMKAFGSLEESGFEVYIEF